MGTFPFPIEWVVRGRINGGIVCIGVIFSSLSCRRRGRGGIRRRTVCRDILHILFTIENATREGIRERRLVCKLRVGMARFPVEGIFVGGIKGQLIEGGIVCV